MLCALYNLNSSMGNGNGHKIYTTDVITAYCFIITTVVGCSHGHSYFFCHSKMLNQWIFKLR